MKENMMPECLDIATILERLKDALVKLEAKDREYFIDIQKLTFSRLDIKHAVKNLIKEMEEQSMKNRKITSLEERKTPAMKIIEIELGESIEDLLRSGSTRDLGARLGVSHTVISIWRDRLGVRVV